MRSSFFALLVFVTSTASPAFAKDIDVESNITAATVYSDRATLTRSATVEIPAGAHNLVFKGLPVNLYADSLRTEGTSRANVTFGALTHKRDSHEDYVRPREKELSEQLVTLQDQRALYQVEKQSLEAGRGFLNSLGKQAALRTNEDIAEIELNPESWANATDSLTSKMMENLKSAHALDIQIRDVNQKIQKVQNELNGLRTGQKQTYSVTIPFESDGASTLTVKLNYQIPGVSWQPLYDARLDVKSGKMELIQYGSVWQRTGEDWNDVDLTLSTAQPSRGTSLPDLHTHWVSLLQHNYRAQKKGVMLGQLAANMSGAAVSAPRASMEADMAMEEGFMELERAVTTQVAQINTDGFVGEYKITGPATVKSDGTQAKLLIGQFDTENAKQVQIKPQYNAEAYLVVKTKLKGEAPILPGQVNLFRDGAFIGKSHLPMLRPGDIEELGFGVDDNVRVKRNTLENKNSEAGLISKESVMERHYVTEVQNLHKDPVDIAILETVPVSQDERIRVEIMKDKTTAGYESDLHNVKGLTRWQKTLKPSEKTEVTLGWKVSWPKGENISGL